MISSAMSNCVPWDGKFVPRSDQYQISPNNITTRSIVQVKRMNGVISTDEMP